MTENAWGAQTQFFYSLTQDHVLNAIDELGFRTTGRCLPLNSMENRVYELEIECENPTSASDNFVVAKFYRPGRWNRAQIKQEHQFLFDLANAEIPVIAPKMFDSESLFQMDSGLFYCVFPKKGGRLLDEMNEDQVAKLGRTLARMHNIGSMHPAPDRIKISPETYGDSNIAFLETSEKLTHTI
jgi:Ser/Thr protein kinase RdoA (MazF antagonist)